VRHLAEILVQAREKVRNCEICGALTEKSPCPICSDSRRDASIVCLVERAVDILTVEKAGSYRGKFHVLGGKISPLNGVGPEDLQSAAWKRESPGNRSRKSSWPCLPMWKETPRVPICPNALPMQA